MKNMENKSIDEFICHNLELINLEHEEELNQSKLVIIS